MAYDPKDPADKKIVDKLIADAVEAREAELAAEHDEAIKGLKDKNKELLAKVKAGTTGDPKEVEALETQVEDLNKKIRELEKGGKKYEKQIADLTAERDGANKAVEKHIVEWGLTEALTAAKVPAQFLPGANALLQNRVTVVTDGEAKVAKIGDKTLGDFVKEWSQGDEGKHYVAAPVNGGGNAPGGHGGQGSQQPTMKRADFNALPVAEQATLMSDAKTRPTLTD